MPAVRLERIGKRARSGDPHDLEELRRLEGRERAGTAPEHQQLDAVRALADFEVRNDGDLGRMHEALQRVLERCQRFERPGWDVYFMSIARVVASRSNCVKRKVAALITVDRRIISTGYNGTPRGAPSCNGGGGPRCNRFAPSGTGLLDCICSHAEENAIVQAALHGIPVSDAVIYTTYSPCLQCTKMIINARIGTVVYNEAYEMPGQAFELLSTCGVDHRPYKP